MTLLNLLMRQNTDTQSSHGDLVTKVSRLAHCLLQTAPDPAKPTDGLCDDVLMVIEDALGAALEAEHATSCHRERLSFLEQLCGSDELTGVFNRRGFIAELDRELSMAQRHKEGGILVFVDLDGFKPVNDTHGHAAGDAVLKHVAHVLQDNVRGTDVVGRLGGDEFAVLLTRTTWDSGLTRAATLEDALNNTAIDWQGSYIPVQASFGYKPYGPYDRALRVLAAADAAMYMAKRAKTSPPPMRIVAAE